MVQRICLKKQKNDDFNLLGIRGVKGQIVCVFSPLASKKIVRLPIFLG